MKEILNIFLFLSLNFVNIVSTTQEDTEYLVDYYENWISRKQQQFIDYDYPTDARMYEAEDKIPREYGTFDFIVVGGGTTGSVVASRLSEISKWRVLVLEAGTFADEDITTVPAWNLLNMFSKFNWGYRSVSQENTFLGRINRTCEVPRGKGIGGTSLINGLIYSRSTAKDYNELANILNDTSWNYEHMLPYFKKSESFTKTNPFAPIDQEYHGYEGPLHISQAPTPTNLSNTILKGVEEIGYNRIDYNGKDSTGGSIFQFNIYKGRRFSSEMAFLLPAKQRPNLKILYKSYVIRLLFSKDFKKVLGVIFTRNNKTYIVRCRKEVILSAGAISTPQILMLSGIGPQDHLQSLAIPVIQDLPVGKNLLDHTNTILIFSSDLKSNLETLKESIEDLLRGQGSLTKMLLADAVFFSQTSLNPIENHPDAEFMFIPFNGERFDIPYYGFSEEVLDVLKRNISNPFGINVALFSQKSRGTITLKSSDPYEYPLINPNLLSDKEDRDIEELYQSVQIALKLLKTESLRSLNASLAFTHFPGCNHTEPLSREYWYCYFRRFTFLGYHEMGTCPLGTSPKRAVVDNELKVFGTQGLRIIDASVFPFPPRGHMTAACTAIAEKITDIIKNSLSD